MAILALLLALLSWPVLPIPLFIPQAVAEPSEYGRLQAEAEARFAERSYAQAHELFARAAALDLPPDERRWVDFRLLDSSWRSAAANPTADSTDLDKARQGLEAFLGDTTAPPDRIRAEANESLGDFWWTRQRSRNLPAAMPYYTAALDWWAGSRELETARRRYLQIVWRMAEPPYPGSWYATGQVPPAVLENALSIAQSSEDRSHAHYLLAARLRNDGSAESSERVVEEYEGALAGGRAMPWYDSALFEYAQWFEQTGQVVVLASGDTTRRPDYEKALTLYRRLVSEYRDGESRWLRDASAAIERITAPSISVSASNVFLPGSEVDFQLSWRNAGQIDLSITRVDLPGDIRFGTGWNPLNWKESLPVGERAAIKRWSRKPETAAHQPGSERIVVDGKLPTGAYVLDVRTAGASARDLLLISDLALVVKNATDRTLIYTTDALTGAPVAGAHVLLAQHPRDAREDITQQRADTGPDGLVSFTGPQSSGEFVAFVGSGERQAFAGGWSSAFRGHEHSWKVYAFSDRPAYRPDEVVHWKYVARRSDENGYYTPIEASIRYEIFDPRGAKVGSGTPRLNGFGSAWSDLALTEAMPLGEYRVVFHEGNHEIGSATLFRLEEYKLPEFRVSVITPEENGRRKSFRLGDTVDAVIEASYFFGGPVMNADVEIVVHQQPLMHFWRPRSDYSWLDRSVAPPTYGDGQIVKRTTTRTDADGRARVSFTASRSGGDQRYRIEARVTDASRREIRGEGEIRVTGKRYEVHATARHSIHRPGEKVIIDFKAIDANDQPVRAAGRVTLTRDHWYEIWLDPENREIRGADLERARARMAVFPPPPENADRRWRIKSRGYTHEDVLSTSVKTDDEGNAELAFTPAREGFYRISWIGDDAHPESANPPASARDLIKAETAIWVASNATTDLGYRHDGVEILVDRDSLREGQTAPVMIVTPASGRDVLFTVESERIDDARVVHMDGTVKLIELPIGKRFVPNTTLAALSVYDLQLSVDEKRIAVPPVKQFLDVEVKADRSELRPRDESRITITTRDRDGHAVAAEVAVGLVDESVFSIQQPYAPDPRPFFFGHEKPHTVQTTSSFQQRAYVRLVRDSDGNVIDERTRSLIEPKESDQLAARNESRMSAKAEGGVVGGLIGAPASPVQDFARAESITVTAAAPPVPEGAGQPGAVEVRSDFRSTVFWQPDVMTGADGRATVNVRYPDSLTTWRATARAITAETQVGVGEATSKTSKPLIVRLESPRFLVVGDRAVISAVVNNNTDHMMRVTPSLEAKGVDSPQTAAVAVLEVGPHAEARRDWTVSATRAGSAQLAVVARAVGESLDDAMRKELPVYEHGIEKLLGRSGRLRSAEAVVPLELPAARRPGSTTLVVQVTPSIATAMLDALPFLIDYPYGCTEQTMSRFLPAAIVARTLEQLGLDPDDVAGRAFGGVEAATAGATHPRGAHLERMNDVVRKGMARLYDFQHADGGWGWWKKGGSDPFMTAYVVWGFSVARDGGLDVRSSDIDRSAAWLERRLVESEADVNAQAWILHALAGWRGKARSEMQTKAFANVWRSRDRLSPYSRALLAMAAEQFGDHQSAVVLIRNLENGVKVDRTPDQSIVGGGSRESATETMETAHWGEDGFWWRWWESPVETTAFALRAMIAIDPQNRLVEPAMNWLVKNRRGAQWNNTRDSAIAVLALNDYLKKSGELAGSGAFELSVNGSQVAIRNYGPNDILKVPSRFPVDPKLLKDGINEVRIRRTTGSGTLYFSSVARFFSLEEPIPAAGHEIFVRRRYERRAGRPTLLKGYVYDGLPLGDRGAIPSGQRIEVVVTVEAKNDYDYLMFEDLKPAGLEAVELTSGDDLVARELKSSAVTERLARSATPAGTRDDAFTGRSQPVYRELRDRKVALFIDHLPQGVWEIRYVLRAEVPGVFHALPLVGQAMYVPEIRANGDETRLEVSERR